MRATDEESRSEAVLERVCCETELAAVEGKSEVLSRAWGGGRGVHLESNKDAEPFLTRWDELAVA